MIITNSDRTGEITIDDEFEDGELGISAADNDYFYLSKGEVMELIMHLMKVSKLTSISVWDDIAK
jgi:hypothetical protein